MSGGHFGEPSIDLFYPAAVSCLGRLVALCDPSQGLKLDGEMSEIVLPQLEEISHLIYYPMDAGFPLDPKKGDVSVASNGHCTGKAEPRNTQGITNFVDDVQAGRVARILTARK